MLPNGYEPLVLADGTVINPEDGTVIQDEILVEVPNTEQIKREIVASRKRISDLPVPPNQMNTLSIILSYTLFGINDQDISNVLVIPEDQINAIKMSDEYRAVQEQIVKSIVKSDESDVRGMFVQHSRHAATTMFDLLNSDSEHIKGNAAKDILDRAGQRPVDVVEHRHQMDGNLTIEYVDKKTSIPTIDVTPDGEF